MNTQNVLTAPQPSPSQEAGGDCVERLVGRLVEKPGMTTRELGNELRGLPMALKLGRVYHCRDMDLGKTVWYARKHPNTKVGSAWCQWGRLSRIGVCGKPVTCYVADSEGRPTPTCREHQAVARKLEWEIRPMQNEQGQARRPLSNDKQKGEPGIA